MNYTDNFKSYVNKCIELNHYVGIGKPYSNILIIGKEAYIDDNQKHADNDNLQNAQKWAKRIENQEEDVYIFNAKEHPDKYLFNSWGKNTWSNYQILAGESNIKYEIDFLDRAFTTEMNESASKTSRSANKDSIARRLKLFKESAFIQEFPVIVLACSNYIKNNNKIKEIDDTFNVTFDGKDGVYTFTKCNWFYTHHSEDGKKLVIHTRQLSQNVSRKMLEEMKSIINNHLKNLTVDL